MLKNVILAGLTTCFTVTTFALPKLEAPADISIPADSSKITLSSDTASKPRAVFVCELVYESSGFPRKISKNATFSITSGQVERTTVEPTSDDIKAMMLRKFGISVPGQFATRAELVSALESQYSVKVKPKYGLSSVTVVSDRSKASYQIQCYDDEFALSLTNILDIIRDGGKLIPDPTIQEF